MPIVTQRLMLCTPQAEDGFALYEAKLESWEELAPWNILVWGEKDDSTIEHAEEYCIRKEEMWQKREDFTVLAFDKDTGELIGGGGLHKCDWDAKTCFLGYWVRTSQTGKGYATEIGQALLDYTFDVLKMETVTSHHDEGNDGSRRVLQKLGFEERQDLPNNYIYSRLNRT